MKSCGWPFSCGFLKRWFVTALELCTVVLLRMFRFKDHVNIPTSGLQFVVVIFEIDVASPFPASDAPIHASAFSAFH